MKKFFNLLKSAIIFLKDALVGVFSILKFLLGKCWKLILIIFGALFGIKLAKQAISKEGMDRLTVKNSFRK